MLVSQYAEITEGKQMIMSGGLGTMGYGLPGGIGAKIGNPDRPVIVISGDGGVQMNIQELATAVLEELPVILCIFNNEYLGMVRQWQKLFYGKRYAMTNLRAGALSRRTEGWNIHSTHRISSDLQRATGQKESVSQRKRKLQQPSRKQKRTQRHLQ